MATMNMRPPAGGGSKKASTGANPAKQPKVSNAPAAKGGGSAKGMSSPSSKGGSKIKMSTSVGHGMTWKNSKGC